MAVCQTTIGPTAGLLRWVVYSQGDDGNRFEVERLKSRAEALEVAASMEALGHRQTYWVEDPTGWTDLICDILSGGVSPTPSRAQLVSALAAARRSRRCLIGGRRSLRPTLAATPNDTASLLD